MSRDNILHTVRTALGRNVDQPPSAAPAALIAVPTASIEEKVDSFCQRLEALAGKTHRAASFADALDYVQRVVAGRPAVASNAPVLAACGVTALASVRSGLTDRGELRALCSTAAVGITSADYCLADTGTLVMLSSREEARLISLLPPIHVAVVGSERILSGLDELLTAVPLPAEQSSSMVLITGPSRTADIEQILVRGVHGPGEIHVVILTAC